MCGIAGFVQREPHLPHDLVLKQLELLEHRGPDSAGFHGRGRGVVGQTRLSIIDLETGDPPITNEDGSVGVAHNGEIYNYRQLRESLLANGHVFRTSGDTEVLAHLAEDLAPRELALAVDGMFVFAVWDERSETLTIVRDGPGKKPIYYWYDETIFVFASELKALLRHPSVPRRLDEGAVPAYLTFGYVPTPETFYEGVRSIPPGHVLTVAPGHAPKIEQYWDPLPAGVLGRTTFPGTFREAARDVRHLLKASVENRLVADVPLGAFLSGGIDSSAVVGLMTELGHRPVRTFTIGFEDKDGFDERAYASLVAKRFGTEHHEEVVQPDAVDLVERFVWYHDQPFGDSSAIPTYLLSEITRKEVTVALCGDGGDELFAGYERFAAAQALTSYLRLPSSARAAMKRIVHRIPAAAVAGRVGSAQRFTERADEGLPDAFLSWISYVRPGDVAKFVGTSPAWAVDGYRRVWDRTAGADVLNRLLYLNYRTYLLDDLLVKVDRMSMAHGLEVRAPFLDRALTDLAFSLPGAYKLKRLVLKRVLKAAVSDLLPREVLHRAKRGFGVPLARWFRTDLNPYLRSMIAAPRARLNEHVEPASVAALLEEHEQGRRDNAHALWALLTLEAFLRQQE